jgi:hypothetical protein
VSRTATSEVGHFSDVFIFWDYERLGEEPCSSDDNGADTPNQKGQNEGALIFLI